MKIKREILIEKNTKPNYVNKDITYRLYRWTNRAGFYHRYNNLPATIIEDPHEIVYSFYDDGYFRKQIVYCKINNIIKDIITKKEMNERYLSMLGKNMSRRNINNPDEL